ncbi:MAG TPA: MFS transporter [Polyangiaceae bacterium]|jgi:MFS family permease|nr:MFS transporter [Polyangiaceae bacterium]
MTRVRPAAATLRPPSVVEESDYRLYLAASLLSTLAEQMVSVAVGWQLYALTGRAVDLGLVGLAQFIPGSGLSLLAGHTTDRHDRRRIAVLCFVALGAVCALLCVPARADVGVWQIYATMALFSAARTFLHPALQALLPDLVSAERFPSAVAWSSSLGELGAIAGPAMGGVLYGITHGAAGVYATALVAYAAAAGFAATLSARTAKREAEAASLRAVAAGVTYIFRNKIVLASISLDLFAVLFGGAVALLPIFARDILHVGPWGFGLLRSAPALGPRWSRCSSRSVRFAGDPAWRCS